MKKLFCLVAALCLCALSCRSASNVFPPTSGGLQNGILPEQITLIGRDIVSFNAVLTNGAYVTTNTGSLLVNGGTYAGNYDLFSGDFSYPWGSLVIWSNTAAGSPYVIYDPANAMPSGIGVHSLWMIHNGVNAFYGAGGIHDGNLPEFFTKSTSGRTEVSDIGPNSVLFITSTNPAAYFDVFDYGLAAGMSVNAPFNMADYVTLNGDFMYQPGKRIFGNPSFVVDADKFRIGALDPGNDGQQILGWNTSTTADTTEFYFCIPGTADGGAFDWSLGVMQSGSRTKGVWDFAQASLVSRSLVLTNLGTLSAPAGADLGPGGGKLWVSNKFLFYSYSADGSTATTVKIAP